MANKRSIVSLQQLPEEVLTIIVQKTGKASSAGYCNLRATCKIMRQASEKPEVLQSLCLSPLVKKPLRAMVHKQIHLKCLYQNNNAAIFIEGIITYFVENNVAGGLANLRRSALGEGDDEILEACYLYGVLRFLHGDPLTSPYDEMPFMYWREGEEDLVARVWKNLRKMLHGIRVDKKRVYKQSLRIRRPVRSCHILDMEFDCSECFMYKRGMKLFYMTQFVPYLH